MIKIGFCGLPKSGKSSLCLEVKKILALKQKVTLLEDISSATPYDIDAQYSFFAYFFLLTNQINNEILAASRGGDFLITDQTVFDYYFRWLFFQKKKAETSVDNDKKEIMQALFNFWKNSYNLLFFVKRGSLKEQTNPDNSSQEILSLPILNQLELLYKKNFEKEKLEVIQLITADNSQEAALNAVQIILKKNAD